MHVRSDRLVGSHSLLASTSSGAHCFYTNIPDPIWMRNKMRSARFIGLHISVPQLCITHLPAQASSRPLGGDRQHFQAGLRTAPSFSPPVELSSPTHHIDPVLGTHPPPPGDHPDQQPTTAPPPNAQPPQSNPIPFCPKPRRRSLEIIALGWSPNKTHNC